MIIFSRYYGINLPAFFSLPEVEHRALQPAGTTSWTLMASWSIFLREEEDVVNNQRDVLEMSADNMEVVARALGKLGPL